jgi:hypothetical protein
VGAGVTLTETGVVGAVDALGAGVTGTPGVTPTLNGVPVEIQVPCGVE